MTRSGSPAPGQATRAVLPRLACALVLTLTVNACGGGGAGSPGGTPPAGGGGGRPAGGQAQAPALTENDVNPIPRDRLPAGGTFRWPIGNLPLNFNYYQVDGLTYENERVMSALLPSTFHFDAAGTPATDPDLLESVELTATPHQVVTYRINPNAVWSDGTPITWRDFEAQWKALNGKNPAYQIASANGYDRIASVVRGSTEREAVVTFATPYVDWQGMYGPLYPASTMSDPNVFNSGWKDHPLLTAGPFRLDRVDRTAQTITLVRNERWWGAPAKLDRIVYRVISPDAQIDALANGEVDFIDVGPNVDKLQRARSIAGIDVRIAGSPNFRLIILNGQSKLLRDVEVRKAIAMGIDRETIAKALLGPLGVPAVPLGNHFFMNNQPGYVDNSHVVAYNACKAAAMLDEAGWTPGSRAGTGAGPRVRTKDGAQLALRFVIPADRAEAVAEAELVRGMLAEISVTVTIETVPQADFQTYVTTGNFDLTTLGFQGGPLSISDSESLFAAPVVGPDGRLDIQQNYSRVGSPQIDAALDRASAELDPQRARALANAADVLIWQIAGSVTTYQRPDIIATRSTVANFGAFGFAQPVTYTDIGFAQSERTQ